MLKRLKSAWNLTVNLGWLAVVGYIGLTHFKADWLSPSAQGSVQPPAIARPVQAEPVVAAEPVARPVQAEPVAPPVQAEPRPKSAPVQKAEETQVVFRQPEPPIQPVSFPAQNVSTTDYNPWAPQDFPPTFEGKPQYLCEGGTCRIDPRYKYTNGEPRVGPEPVIYFPQPPLPPGIPPGDSPQSSLARYANDEMRWTLNEFKFRLRWTPKVLKYLDLSEMGPCPWDTRQVEKQNQDLKWRIRQLGLMMQGYATED